jgi:hypothetical protein
MAKIIRHDYSVIHDALNNMIVAEVKAALSLLPEKSIEADKVALCRVVISPNGDYVPQDVAVWYVKLDEDSGQLVIGGKPGMDDRITEYYEDDDFLDITDFGYLITQIADKVEDGKTAAEKRRIQWAVHKGVLEDALKVAAQKIV